VPDAAKKSVSREIPHRQRRADQTPKPATKDPKGTQSATSRHKPPQAATDRWRLPRPSHMHFLHSGISLSSIVQVQHRHYILSKNGEDNRQNMSVNRKRIKKWHMQQK